MVHRILKASLKGGGLTRAEKEKYGAALGGICESCSERERSADETEREIETLKKVEYMARFVGTLYRGVISGVTSFGMFVELENTVEGLVRLSDIHDDYYIFDAKGYALTGEDSGKRYRLGDAVEVRLVRADAESRQIDFELMNQYDYGFGGAGLPARREAGAKPSRNAGAKPIKNAAGKPGKDAGVKPTKSTGAKPGKDAGTKLGRSGLGAGGPAGKYGKGAGRAGRADRRPGGSRK
jgi:ribonuclease R